MPVFHVTSLRSQREQPLLKAVRSQKPDKKPMGRAQLGHSWARNGDVCVTVMLVVIKLGHRE